MPAPRSVGTAGRFGSGLDLRLYVEKGLVALNAFERAFPSPRHPGNARHGLLSDEDDDKGHEGQS